MVPQEAIMQEARISRRNWTERYIGRPVYFILSSDLVNPHLDLNSSILGAIDGSKSV